MTTAPSADKKTATKTAYRVLKFPDAMLTPEVNLGDTDISKHYKPGLQDLGVFEALTKLAAIRIAVEKHGAGDYVAVTNKSWKPVRIIVTTETVVKVGDAT